MRQLKSIFSIVILLLLISQSAEATCFGRDGVPGRRVGGGSRIKPIRLWQPVVVPRSEFAATF